MARPRWILDLHEDFPASALVRDRVPDPIVLTRRNALLGDFPKVDGPVVGYGTMHTMTRLARVSSGVFDDYTRLRCSSYYRWVYDLLGRVAVIVPFNALPSLPLEKMFGPRVFVRTDTNYKLFPAGVHAVREVPRLLAKYIEHHEELVVVADVVDFEAEYRCFCRASKFVCGSSYPSEPYREVPTEVRAFAEDVARRLVAQGISMATIDVGMAAGKPLLVELGGVNSWGIYGSNLDDFIEMMEAEALLLAEGA